MDCPGKDMKSLWELGADHFSWGEPDWAWLLQCLLIGPGSCGPGKRTGLKLGLLPSPKERCL